MKHYFHNSEDRGVTLIETLVVVIIISILAAIAAPNFLGLLSRNRVNEALDKINGAIKESQRQAIRKRKLCRVNIDTSTNIISGNPTDCLLSTRDIRNSIDIRTNLSGTPPNILFSAKGSTTKSGTIVVSSDTSTIQRCFVISLGLGITRTGEYTGSKTGSVSAEYCVSN